MLKFRRAAPKAVRTEPAAPRKGPVVVPAEATNADKARALMAMLEQGGDAAAAGVAPERLRDWARDLVETVERRRWATGPDAAAPVAPAMAAAPTARLFKAPAPMLKPAIAKDAVRTASSGTTAPGIGPAIADTRPQTVPAQPVSAASLAAVAFRLPAPAPATALVLPVQHATDASRPSVEPVPVALTQGEVRRLIDATADPETLAREHPAIIAMTLVGRSTLDQAAALRRLPGGQVRAVHRALRMMEEAAS